MEATIRDLRLHTAEVLAAADRGERVTITSRGQARAVLMRCEEAGARAQSCVWSVGGSAGHGR